MINLTSRKHSNSSPTFRRGFFYALLVLFCSLSVAYPESTSSIPSTVIYGRTVDQDDHIVPYVSLILQQTDLFILSDKDGNFSYTKPFSNQDSILVQRIGFQNEVISAQTLQNTGIIRLTPVVLELGSVEIQGENTSVAGSILAPLTRYTKSSASGSVDHTKLLRKIPGVSIKSYGGPAGIRSLSIDGGPTSHTKIIIDGIDITSAQNGEADISQLPLPYIESITYIPYDITHTASGGSDGVVMLGSIDQASHLSISKGSFGHTAYDINLQKQFLGVWTSIQLGQRWEDGDYPVTWDHDVHNRKNNNFNQQFVSLKAKGMVDTHLFWQISAMESRQSRGVAGLVWSTDTLSHRNDQLDLLGTTLGWVRPTGSTHIQASLRVSEEYYVNPLLNLRGDHKLHSYQVKIDDRQTLNKRLELLTDLSFSQDHIESSATGEHDRHSFAASINPGITLIKGIKLVPSLKFHVSPNLYEQFLTDIQLQIPFFWGPLEKISLSRGDVYRYPSFNDLYWSPGGNPDLLPEETEVTTAQVQLDLNRFGSLTLQWQRKESTNLIQWIPGFFYWQPENIRSAERESHKIMWQLDKSKYNFSTFANTSLIHTYDQDWKKPLRYAPSQTSAFGLIWSPANYEFNLEYSYISDLISMYDYPVDTMVKAAELWSLSAAHTWQSKFGEFVFVVSGDNLFDISYETIRGYPEPGRSYRITTTYTPTHKYERN